MAEARTGAKIEIYRQDSQKNENHQLQTHFLKHSTYGIVATPQLWSFQERGQL